MLRMIMLFIVLVFFVTHELRSELQVKTNNETGQWLILENDQPVLQYNYKTVPLPEGYLEKLKHGKQYAVPRGDYIHPLYGLNGEPITKDWNNDHPHHRGIYWAWPEVGYKGELGDLHALQKVFARPTGKIETKTENGQLKLVAENVWMWLDKEPIVNEKVTITILPLEKNGRKINLDFRFESLVEEVTLARRSTEHYGGLNIRMQPLNDFKIGSFYGQEEKIPKQQQPAWTYASWKNPQSENRTELTVFEKASNPDYPGELIKYPNLNWFQPTFPQKKTRYPLQKGKPLHLRFQLWLHNASDNDETKKENWNLFQNEK